MAKTQEFHLVMFPWFAFGHMTAFLHLSNKLAQRGHRITFLIPKKAHSHSQLHSLNFHPNLISFHPLTIPQVEGLPPGAETTADIPIYSTHLLTIAMDRTTDQLEAALRALNPDFVVYDFAHWVPDLTSKLGIKSICYNTVSAATIALNLVPARQVSRDRPMTADPPPGYPSSKVVLRPHEARLLHFMSASFGENITFQQRIITAMKHCDAIAIRTCREIEGPFSDYVASQYGKPVFLTGSALPEPSLTRLEDRWANWLGKFKPGSVVYCAFGSEYIPKKDMLQELLLGLELTGLPFLAALKPPSGAATIEEALPEGFHERVGGRGVVYGGWVQQPSILSHPSVGCFVSHCGFGSMWESLMSACQIVLLPNYGEQILNTRLLAEELKIAVEVERDEDGWFSKENLCKSIKSVMDEDSEFGGLVKKNHAKWKEALLNPEFMNNYIDNFAMQLQGLLDEN